MVLAAVVGAPAYAQAPAASSGALDVAFTSIEAVVTAEPTDATDATETTDAGTTDAETTAGGSGDVVVVARVRNIGSEPVTDLSGTLSAHERVTSRFGFQRALDSSTVADGELGQRLGRVQRPLADLDVGQSRFLVFQVHATELGIRAGPDAQAVHPLHLQINGRVGEGNTQTLSELNTALIAIVGPIARPLHGSMLVELVKTDAPRETATGLPSPYHAELLAALTRTDAAVTVTVDNVMASDQILSVDGEPNGDSEGEPQEAVPAAREALARLLSQPTVEQVTTVYADADLVALTRGGLDALAGIELRLGARAWPGVDTPPTSAVIVPPAGLNAATLETIVEPFGVRGVVLAERYLDIAPDRELPASPSPVRPLATDGQTPVAALVPDPWLGPLLSEQPELNPSTVQRILAETAVLYLERPAADEQRGVLLAPTDPVALAPSGLVKLLDALDAAPWLRLTTLEALRTDVAPSTTTRLAYGQQAREAELPADYIAELGAAEQTLSSLAAVLDETDPELAQLRENLLLAASTGYRDDLDAGRRLIDSVAVTANEVFDAVRVIGRPTVTFTDAQGQLPVVIRNTASVPLTVRVHLTSSRLSFPGNDREIVLDAGDTSTMLFSSEARSPGGTAPVDVVITDPSGERELATGAIIVRIAAYPLTALLLIAGAAIALVLWWVRDLRSRRRSPAGAPEQSAQVDAA